jgi:hypothetical protein
MNKTEILITFTVPATICLNELQRIRAREVLNRRYFNDPDVNEIVDGKYVGKYDDHPEFKDLQNAHYALCGYKKINVKIGLTTAGTFKILDCE